MMRLSVLFCALSCTAQTTVETPHVKLSWSASAAAGRNVTLVVEIDIGPGLHVYAPGVEHGYIPIAWSVKDAGPVTYPAPRLIEFAALKEIVPVYEGHLRLTRELTIPRDITSIEGSFRYQACNDRECFPPRTLPMKWTFQRP